MDHAEPPPGPQRAAVGYVRTSTKKQEDSPDAQRSAIGTWAHDNGVDLRIVYEEQISSGVPLFERAKLLDAIGDLQPGELLLAVARDRFARDSTKMVLVERLVGFSGGEVTTLDGLGGAGPDAVMLRGIKDVIAAWERSQAALRTRRVMHSKRKRAEKLGSAAPYGYMHVDQTTVEHRAEQATIRRILELRSKGATVAAICRALNACCRSVPRGAEWHPTTVNRILRANK